MVRRELHAFRLRVSRGDGTQFFMRDRRTRMNESEFFKKIREAGGRGYLAGGAVRDMVMGRAAHDRDYLVCGMLPEEFTALFPEARRAGKSFPVFLLEIGGAVCEVAFARVERKTGRGYTGFEARCGRDITVEQDLVRRDTTINSMAMDDEGRIIDPYGGAADVGRKIIRATSPAHFAEDPVRALRAARQAAQFGFDIEPATLALMGRCAEELRTEPAERKFAELEKALASPRRRVFSARFSPRGCSRRNFRTPPRS